MSQIADVLEQISEKIASNPVFKGIPIYYDEVELNKSSGQFPCILYKVRAWQPRQDCSYERILEIRIITEDQSKRDAITNLWDYEEALVETLDEAILEFDFELSKLGGSELAIMTYAKKDKDSYKGTGTLNGSVVIDYYRLRY